MNQSVGGYVAVALGFAAIRDVERRYPDPERLQREMERWDL